MFMFTKLYIRYSVPSVHHIKQIGVKAAMLDVSGVIFKIVIDLTRVYHPPRPLATRGKTT